MSKWKLFNRNKVKQEIHSEIDMTADQTEKPEEKISEQNAVPIKEYNETLYSTNTAPKKTTAPGEETKQPLKRTSWENPSTIEQNVDTMRKTQTESSEANTQTSNNIDKKVDQILAKKKIQP